MKRREPWKRKIKKGETEGRIIKLFCPEQYRIIIGEIQKDFNIKEEAFEFCHSNNITILPVLTSTRQAKELKLNKSALEKFIAWSSSRYNSMSKKQVIDTIINNFYEGKTGSEVFECGSYTESGSLCGQDYHVNYDSFEIYTGKYQDDNFLIKEKLELRRVNYGEKEHGQKETGSCVKRTGQEL